MCQIDSKDEKHDVFWKDEHRNINVSVGVETWENMENRWMEEKGEIGGILGEYEERR